MSVRDDAHAVSDTKVAANVLPDTVTSEESSQASTSTTRVAPSQQPSVDYLRSLGISVRDFAYESTLPAVVPVPRVRRQIQPGPDSPKRSQSDESDREELTTQSHRGESNFKRPKLERKPTEPVEEPPVVQPLRTLRRKLTVKRVCSAITAPSGSAFPTMTRTRFSTSPPTSPLTLPLSHVLSQEPEAVQATPSFPFVVHVDDTHMIATSQFDPESQPLSLRPALYTKITLETNSRFRSPAPNPPRITSPVPLLKPIHERPSPAQEPGASVRKRRRRGSVGTTPVPSRYQLRQRPVRSCRASNGTPRRC